MTAQTANEVTVPTGSDGWKLTEHFKQAFESAQIIIPVADQAERDGLAARFPGGALPIPTYVGRMDRAGDVEVWTGSAWRGITETSDVTTSDTNWAYTGQLSRVSSTSGKRTVTMGQRLARTGGAFTLGSTPLPDGNTYKTLIPAFVPSGWRPAATVNGWALLTASDDSPLATVWWRITTAGDLQARLDNGSTSLTTGCRLHLSGNWTTA